MHKRKGLMAVLLAVALAVCPTVVGTADEVAPAAFVFGNLNEDQKVDASDALMVLQHSVKLLTLPEESLALADVNADGEINASDALMILQKSVGLIEEFPAGQSYLRAQALDGIFTKGTMEVVDEENTAIGADIGLYNADMTWVGSTLYAYYPGEGGIRLATSADGVTFADAGLVIPENEEFWSVGGAENPSIFVDNGTFYLAYDGYSTSGKNSICLATSTDGKSFVCEGEIFYYSGKDKEAAGASHPDIIKVENVWYMTYTADNGDDKQICVAFSMEDLYRLDRSAVSPAIKTALQGYDSGALGRRDVVYVDGYYYMVYSTGTEPADETASWSHSFARSTDMFNWIPLGRILLPATESGYGMDLPNFVVDGSDVWVYYREGDHSRRAKLDYDASRVPEEIEPVDTTSAAVAATLDGLFTGQTTEVLTDTRIGGSFNMHFPDFLKVGDEIWAYYIGASSKGQMATRLAVSTDGVNFTNKGVVLEPSEDGWDSTMTSFAGIWYEDGIFYLAYEGSGTGCNGAVGLATSTDGIHFEKQGMILDYTGTGYERINTGTPDLYKEGDTWYLFYHAFDGSACQICVATGPDLYHLTRYEGNPIIPAVPGRFDAGTTGRRDIIYSGGWYYMVYEVSTEPPYGEADWGHTFARSKDLITWEALDHVIYPTTGGGMGHDGPNWYIDGDDVYVYFREPGNTTSRTKLVPVTE